MANNFQTPLPNYQTQMPQFNAQQYFPSPQGNVYMINSLNEINNIPISGGLSAIICLPDASLCLKTIQNGIPMTLTYRLSSMEKENSPELQTKETPKNEKVVELLKSYGERISKIEKNLTGQKGGNLECLF